MSYDGQVKFSGKRRQVASLELHCPCVVYLIRHGRRYRGLDRIRDEISARSGRSLGSGKVWPRCLLADEDTRRKGNELGAENELYPKR